MKFVKTHNLGVICKNIPCLGKTKDLWSFKGLKGKICYVRGRNHSLTLVHTWTFVFSFMIFICCYDDIIMWLECFYDYSKMAHIEF